MRGGAIPVFAWGTLLLVLFIGNWIWDAKDVNAAEAAFAALVVYAAGVGLWLSARRDALRRGPPPARAEIEASPSMSVGAVLAGLAVAAILFGLVWAQFLVFFGAGLLVAALGRLWIELRAEQRSRRAVQERQAR
jgi:hypothetical protein